MERKKTTAQIEADKAVTTAQNKVKASKKAYTNAKKKVAKYKKSKNKSLTKKWQKKEKSSKQKLDRDNKALTKAQKKADSLKVSDSKQNLAGMISQIKEHNQSNIHEGHAAIYVSDGSDSTIIYIAPTENESEDNTTNVTTWPRDEGAPASNYARVAGKNITVSGIIKGETRAEANQKFYQLRVWNSRHYMLTYTGNLNYKHLNISDLQVSYKDKVSDIDVSITFTFSYAAKITTDDSKGGSGNSKKKTSKSSKTVTGNRSKKYTAITIKSGDTLWAYSQKYGKSVSWLQKVNHIKGTTIYAGKKIRVK